MARINIEECWWSDPRRSKLARIVGDESKADGLALRMWRVAQEFWDKGRQKVPIHVFETLEFHEALLGCHLASLGEDGVYVRGSSEYLEWVLEEKQKRIAGGKKSAQRPRNEKGQLLPKAAVEPSKDPSELQVESKIGPSESNNAQVSGSSSSSRSKNNTLKAKRDRLPTEVSQTVEIGRFIKAYIKAFQAIPGYGENARPDLSPKILGEMQRYLKGAPIDRACELIQVFCQMDDDWFKKKAYDFTTFTNNLSKVGVALDTGQLPGREDKYAFLKAVPNAPA